MNLTRTWSIPKEGKWSSVSETWDSPVPRALTALWESASSQDSIQARFLFSFPPKPYTVSHPTPVLATRNAGACDVGETEQEAKWEQGSVSPVSSVPSFFKEPRGNLRALRPRSCSFLHSNSLHFLPQKWALAHPGPRALFSLRRPYVRDVFFQFFHPLQGCILGFCIFQQSPHIKHVV